MKKSVITTIAIAMSICAWAHQYEAEVNGVTWYYNVIGDGVAEITYKGEDLYGEGWEELRSRYEGVLSVPEKIDGLKIVSIGTSAFELCNELKELKLSDNIKRIGHRAFLGSSLEKISLPSALDSLGAEAFDSCEKLTEITLPGGFTTIGYETFTGCILLKTIEIPQGVTQIGNDAFCWCPELESVYIPSSVRSIGSWAFADCAALKTIYVDKDDAERIKGLLSEDEVFGEKPEQVNALSFVEKGAEKPSYTFAIDENGVLTGYTGNIPSELVIPEGVKEIGDHVFMSCENIVSVKLPQSVVAIGPCAFMFCHSLTSIDLPEGLESVGHEAFCECEKLLLEKLPESLTKIGAGAFSGVPKYELAMARLAFGGGAFSSGAANTVVVKQEVIHYVLNSVQPEFTKPVSEDAGFVNVIAEVKGNNVAVPQTWAESYPEFVTKFGSDFTKALTAKSGKIAAGGREMLVWEDYVAGTDPTDPNDKFTASVTIVDGKVVVSYTPQLDADRAAMRKYTTYGKVKLTDADWIEVPEGEEADYNFFKVTVEMK